MTGSNARKDSSSGAANQQQIRLRLLQAEKEEARKAEKARRAAEKAEKAAAKAREEAKAEAEAKAKAEAEAAQKVQTGVPPQQTSWRYLNGSMKRSARQNLWHLWCRDDCSHMHCSST